MTFRVGEPVRVSARAHEGHHRTPGYMKGKLGRVERVHAVFRNPETRAYGADGLPEQRLYLVGFAPGELWQEHTGALRERVYADVFEHWLEAAE